jgi:hypothetical protein
MLSSQPFPDFRVRANYNARLEPGGHGEGLHRIDGSSGIFPVWAPRWRLGSEIARDMAYQAPVRIIGLHLNSLAVDPPNPEAIHTMSDSERTRFSYFEREESSFLNLQASEPQTLAYALTDSPVGWLAWMIGVGCYNPQTVARFSV